MKKELVIGIDAGTESVRVGIYDLYGNQVGLGITGYQTYHRSEEHTSELQSR